MKIIVNELETQGVLSKYSIYLDNGFFIELEHLGYCYEEFNVGFTFVCTYSNGEDFYIDLEFKEAINEFVDRYCKNYNINEFYRLEIEYNEL